MYCKGNKRLSPTVCLEMKSAVCLSAVSWRGHSSVIYCWHWFIFQATSQSLFGTELSPVGAATLSPDASSDVFARSGECAAQSYSNMEEVDWWTRYIQTCECGLHMDVLFEYSVALDLVMDVYMCRWCDLSIHIYIDMLTRWEPLDI